MRFRALGSPPQWNYHPQQFHLFSHLCGSRGGSTGGGTTSEVWSCDDDDDDDDDDDSGDNRRRCKRVV